jgi:hypothetical protein
MQTFRKLPISRPNSSARQAANKRAPAGKYQSCCGSSVRVRTSPARFAVRPPPTCGPAADLSAAPESRQPPARLILRQPAVFPVPNDLGDTADIAGDHGYSGGHGDQDSRSQALRARQVQNNPAPARSASRSRESSRSTPARRVASSARSAPFSGSALAGASTASPPAAGSPSGTPS